MLAIEKKLIVVFYKEDSGREPVRIWLKGLEKHETRKIGEDLQTLQYQWPIGMPLVDNLGKGLWELRTRLDTRISRIIFVVKNDCIFLLHGLIKKTEKTPPQDIKLATKRLKKLELQGTIYYGSS